MLNVLREKYVYIMSIPYAEAALRGALMKRRPEKYVANPQENTHTEVRPQQIRRAVLLKSHSNAGAPPQIHRTNIRKHPPTRAPLKDCIHVYSKIQINLK